MAYCVKQDMIDRYGNTELVELTSTGSSIDDTVLTRAITGAEAEINGYLLSKYTLPLSEPPEILKELNCDIARYKLYGRVPPPERVRERYKDSVKMLENISKGIMNLGIINGQSEVAPVGGPQVENTGRVFDRDSLTGWIK